MHPVLIQIDSFTIYSYGVIIAIAFGTGIWLAYRQAERCNIEKNIILDIGLYLILSAFVGGRLFYILTNLDDFIAHPLSMIFSRSGFVFYGGFVVAIITVAIYLVKRKVSFGKVADVFAPSIAVGEAIGRIGCFLHGCCYGKVTSLPWGVVMLPEHIHPIHPTQAYNSLFNAGLFLFLSLLLRRKWYTFDGQIFCWYLILHSAGRFITEFFRGDSPPILWNLTCAQLISILLGLIGIVIIAVKGRKVKII